MAEKRFLSVRMDEGQMPALKARASVDGRSVGSLVRDLVADHFKGEADQMKARQKREWPGVRLGRQIRLPVDLDAGLRELAAQRRESVQVLLASLVWAYLEREGFDVSGPHQEVIESHRG